MEITWITVLTEQRPLLLRSILGQCSHGSPAAGAEGVLLSSTSPDPHTPYTGCQHLEGISAGSRSALPLLAFYCSYQKTLPLCLNPLFVISCWIADKCVMLTCYLLKNYLVFRKQVKCNSVRDCCNCLERDTETGDNGWGFWLSLSHLGVLLGFHLEKDFY